MGREEVRANWRVTLAQLISSTGVGSLARSRMTSFSAGARSDSMLTELGADDGVDVTDGSYVVREGTLRVGTGSNTTSSVSTRYCVLTPTTLEVRKKEHAKAKISLACEHILHLVGHESGTKPSHGFTLESPDLCLRLHASNRSRDVRVDSSVPAHHP